MTRATETTRVSRETTTESPDRADVSTRTRRPAVEATCGTSGCVGTDQERGGSTDSAQVIAALQCSYQLVMHWSEYFYLIVALIYMVIGVWRYPYSNDIRDMVDVCVLYRISLQNWVL